MRRAWTFFEIESAKVVRAVGSDGRDRGFIVFRMFALLSSGCFFLYCTAGVSSEEEEVAVVSEEEVDAVVAPAAVVAAAVNAAIKAQIASSCAPVLAGEAGMRASSALSCFRFGVFLRSQEDSLYR